MARFPISRRTFGLTAAGALTSVSCNRQAPPSQSSAARPGAFEFDETSVAALQEHMASGRYTARQITEKYLARIHQIDKQGPALRAVIEVNPDALAMADALDRERAAKRVRGSLHGIPVLLKDNIETAGRMSTSAGSLALEAWRPDRDAFIAGRLRDAGAVILGKTNLSEWANFRSNHSSSGWSARGGQTRNAYALNRNPCGSSSGSAVAVSANLCAVAIGTETNGSIVCPSAINGIVGIKPTVGLLSRTGIVPIAHSQDTAGPMARTVADAAALLTVLAGSDPADVATAPARPADYTKHLRPDGLSGARIGIARQFFGYNPAVDALMEDAIDAMKRAGAVIVDKVEFPGRGKMGEPGFEVLLYEFKADLDAYLSRVSPGLPVHSLKDLIAFNEKNREREMPYFGQELLTMSEAKGPLTSKPYLEALDTCRRLSRAEGIDALLKKHTLDAIFAPTAGPAWVTDLVTGDHGGGGSSSPAAIAGYPNITVPAGFIHGLPVGASFFGAAWSEPRLIEIAYGFEQTTKARQKPRFLDSVEDSAQS